MTCASLQGLGLQYARQLVQAGCRTLIVASRSAALLRETLEDFAMQGVAIFVVHADSGDASSITAVVGWARRYLPSITHHAHAAGVTGQTLLKVTVSHYSLTFKQKLQPNETRRRVAKT